MEKDDLITASQEGNIEQVLHILNKGVDVNLDHLDNMYGRTALTWASHNGHMDVVKALLVKGATSLKPTCPLIC